MKSDKIEIDVVHLVEVFVCPTNMDDFKTVILTEESVMFLFKR